LSISLKTVNLMNNLKLTSALWNRFYDNVIVDPDGWTNEDAPDFKSDPITLDDFCSLATRSSVRVRELERAESDKINEADLTVSILHMISRMFEESEMDRWDDAVKIVDSNQLELETAEYGTVFEFEADDPRELVSVILAALGVPSFMPNNQ